MSIALATTTQLICILSLVHVSAKHIFSWTPQLLYDFRKHKMTQKKVQVGKDQEKAQSAKDSHFKNPRWEKNQTNNQVPIP